MTMTRLLVLRLTQNNSDKLCINLSHSHAELQAVPRLSGCGLWTELKDFVFTDGHQLLSSCGLLSEG